MKIEENGRSMVEMLGVLAIIGVLSAGAIAGYSKAMYQYKLNKMLDEIQTIVVNVRSLFTDKDYADLGVPSCMSAFGGYEDSNFSFLKSANIAPKEMIKEDHLEHPFKGTVCIGQRVNSTQNNFFTIWIRGLSNKLCIDIASQNWGDISTGFVGWIVYDYPDGDNADLFSCYQEPEDWCFENSIKAVTEYCQCSEQGCEIMLGFK